MLPISENVVILAIILITSFLLTYKLFIKHLFINKKYGYINLKKSVNLFAQLLQVKKINEKEKKVKY